MVCEKCGTQTDRKFCPKCGYPVSADTGAQKVQASLNQQVPPPAYQQPYPPQQAYPQQPYQPYPPQGYYGQQPAVIVQNAIPLNRQRNKWVAFFLCLFLGFLGVHKFYENKAGLGVLYIFTAGLFGIGWFIDLVILLTRPNPYYI